MNISSIKRIKNRIKIRERRKNLKKQAVEYKGGQCCHCKYNKNMHALQFHHINPKEKDFTISAATTTRWDAIKPELDKCILLCANCHLTLHGQEKETEYKKLKEKINYKKKSEHIKTCYRCEASFGMSTKGKYCEKCILLPKQVKYDKNIIIELGKTNSVEEMVKILNSKKSKYIFCEYLLKRYCHRYNISYVGKLNSRDRINWPSVDELAKMVWDKPLIHLAKKLGVSDNAIKKRCKKNNISLPPRGFWLKKLNKKKL